MSPQQLPIVSHLTSYPMSFKDMKRFSMGLTHIITFQEHVYSLWLGVKPWQSKYIYPDTLYDSNDISLKK